ncbi:MAG TPA: fibronectin type III domain-containing protein, partial [Geobacteraceae bacterium]|nr:fibronectin type III domain-containing protein [Geobacteraceae bacterium]
MMNREMMPDGPERNPATVADKRPAMRKKWRQALLIAALTLSFAATAFARGGDPITPFPLTDPLGAKQEAKSMAVDSDGNIIVAGYTNSGGMNNDYQLTKFKADGSGVAWRATFDKSGGDDQVTAVAVDGNNNIIVTGTVWNGSNTDIHTIKYDPDGSLLWQHTWSGTAGADVATAIAVDGFNNIYVAGYTANTSGNDDFLILKYPPAGATPAWQEIWNSSYNSNDRIAAIIAGADGIAVTGASSKSGTDFDILTRKYGIDGSLTWEQRRASAGGGDDRGVAIAMDPSGNVIVAGSLNNGTNSDIYTVKYAATSPGAPVWEKIYAGSSNDEPRAVWVDGADDVYVTGYTYTYSGNEDFYTARYKGSDGTKLWDAIYNSSSDFTDIPLGIAVKGGADGDLFVVGYTTTSSNENITTLKYRKENGVLLWQQSFNGAANRNDRPVGIGLTAGGDVCIAGWTDAGADSYDYLALKYDFGPLNPPTDLVATAVTNTAIDLSWRDNSGNESGFKIERKKGENGTYAEIAVTASDVTTYSDAGLDSNSYYYYRVRSSNAADGDSAYSNEAHALTKVVSYEAPAWLFQYNGSDNREDEAVAITTGSDDHPVVTGFSDLTEEGVAGAYSFDYMTIKLDRGDSTVKWKARYDSGDGGTDMAAGVALDASGNAVVTGTAYLSGGSDKSDDLYTIKYASAGHTDPNSSPPFAWGEQYGTQSGIDQATAVQTTRDGGNNIVVIGHGINASQDEDMFILKYRPDGTSPWPPIVFDGPAHGNDYPSAVATDSAGDIFITGSTENGAGNFDIYTAKYSGASGALLWSQTYAGAGGGDDHGLSMAVDGKGDVYVTGYAVNAAGNEEWVTLK